MKQLLIAVLVVAGIVGAAVLFGKDKAPASVELSNHLYGKEDSSVKVVEYGDFECPACGYYYSIVDQLKEKYKDQISFQFRNFPLTQIHRNALAAHRAAEAASNQGKFWEMYDLLYTNQETWNGPSSADSVGITTAQAINVFEGYAEQLGLNMEQFKADSSSSAVLDIINADTDEGKKLGISGTPTFFINGRKIEESENVTTLDAFSKLIDAELASNQSSN